MKIHTFGPTYVQPGLAVNCAGGFENRVMLNISHCHSQFFGGPRFMATHPLIFIH